MGGGGAGGSVTLTRHAALDDAPPPATPGRFPYHGARRRPAGARPPRHRRLPPRTTPGPTARSSRSTCSSCSPGSSSPRCSLTEWQRSGTIGARPVLGAAGPPAAARAARDPGRGRRRSPGWRSTRGCARRCGTTASPASPTWPTGGSSPPTRATSRPSPRRRPCGTCGRSPSRSSSTSLWPLVALGRPAAAPGAASAWSAVCVAGHGGLGRRDGAHLPPGRPAAGLLRHRQPPARHPRRRACSAWGCRCGSRSEVARRRLRLLGPVAFVAMLAAWATANGDSRRLLPRRVAACTPRSPASS